MLRDKDRPQPFDGGAGGGAAKRRGNDVSTSPNVAHRSLAPDTTMVRDTWDALNAAGETREIRIPQPKRPAVGKPRFYRAQAGWFDNADAVVRAVGDITGEHAEAVYVTVNPVDPELRARTNNRIGDATRGTTPDTNVTLLRYLFVDIDADRVAGVSATDDEKAVALRERQALVDYLTDLHGWPDPFMVGDSGNGGALLYRVDLKNTPGHTDLIRRVLESLATEFDRVDISTHNPSRLMKLPGTVAAKGDGLEHRPWRLSSATFNRDAGVVSLRQLERVAGPAPEPKTSSNGHYDGPGRQWTVEEFLALNNVQGIPQKKSYGVSWDLDRCLTSDAHTDGACLIERSSGALVYKCHHNSCQYEDWHSLRASGRVQIPQPDPVSVSIPFKDTTRPDPELTRVSEHEEPPRPRFRLLTVEDLATLQAPEPVVEDMLFSNTLNVLVGNPAAYKSFIALSVALCAATGTPWHGRQVQQGAVVYVSAEGSAGLHKRIRAWEIATGKTAENFYVIPDVVPFLEHDAVQALREIIGPIPNIVMFVVDTLNRTFVGGDENNPRDMGAWIAGVDYIRRETGALILALHHGTKLDGKTRGHGSLQGALDTEIKAERTDNVVTLTCKKQKDYAEFEPIHLAGRVVDLEDGESSLVLDLAEQGSDNLNDMDQRVLELLHVFGSEGATYTAWRQVATEAGIGATSFYKSRTRLVETFGQVSKDGDGRGAKYRPVEYEEVSF